MFCDCGLCPIIGFGCGLRMAAKACGIYRLSSRKAARWWSLCARRINFARVFVEMGAPTWPNGFDLDPINLYMQMRDAGALTQVAAE
jgi:hypothetical protein